MVGTQLVKAVAEDEVGMDGDAGHRWCDNVGVTWVVTQLVCHSW